MKTEHAEFTADIRREEASTPSSNGGSERSAVASSRGYLLWLLLLPSLLPAPWLLLVPAGASCGMS